jgi:nicotinate-nucleotide adenylyltransferase
LIFGKKTLFYSKNLIFSRIFMIKKAFFGGSFDPPHTGHLGVARAALSSGKCDEVIWFPSYTPPHKINNKRASFDDRVNMIKIMIAREKGMHVSDFENKIK